MEEASHDYSFLEAVALKFNAIAEAVHALVDYLKPYFEAVFNAMKKLYDWIYSLYLEDGAPYGETPEGMLQWFEQKLQLNKGRFAREKADKILWELPYRGLSPGSFN